tara:strand:- start:267 stop:518 length:252 start_codon:yes stop_codon:yes gene_type:complete
MRLTVHIENAPFIKKERKLIGKDKSGKDIFKPKKINCIKNTLTFNGLSRQDITHKLSEIRSKYKIGKYRKGVKKDQEMIQIKY